jgi:hypothetical protein
MDSNEGIKLGGWTNYAMGTSLLNKPCISWEDLLSAFDGRRLTSQEMYADYVPIKQQNKLQECPNDIGFRLETGCVAGKTNKRSFGAGSNLVAYYYIFPTLINGANRIRPRKTNKVKFPAETVLLIDFPSTQSDGSVNQVFNWLGNRDYGTAGQASPTDTLSKSFQLAGLIQRSNVSGSTLISAPAGLHSRNKMNYML